MLMDLDGSSWQEKLLPITSVTTSTQLWAWQPAAEIPLDITDKKMFKTLKKVEIGVKDKECEDALSKCSEYLKI